MLFELVLNLAHVAQVFPDTLDAAKQGPTTVYVGVGASRRHHQVIMLLLSILRQNNLLMSLLCLIKAHRLLSRFALVDIKQVALTVSFLARLKLLERGRVQMVRDLSMGRRNR